MRGNLLLAALALAVTATSAAAQPAAFPQRPVRLIVPFPPAGVNDIVSRLVANRLGALWSRAVIIDNRGGANGTIAGEIAPKPIPTATRSSSSPPASRATSPFIPGCLSISRAISRR